MKIAAAIVAKNEARIIGRCIRSVATFVDHVLLCDTGSTDATIEEAADACFETATRLTVQAHSWTGFATNYTAAFEAARELGDCVWLLDADHVVRTDDAFEMPDDLDAAGYALCRLEDGDWENWYPSLLRSDVAWRYVGERHARPTVPGVTSTKLRGIDVLHMNDGASGSLDEDAKRQRFERDVEHFRAIVEANPSDTRAMFYLAQSLRAAGQHSGAMSAYRTRASMSGGFEEEAYCSRLTLGRYAIANGAPERLVERLLVEAHKSRPSRAEAACELAAYLNDRGRHYEAARWARKAIAAAHNDDRFLVRRSDHSWRPHHELARARRHFDAA